MSAVLRPAPAPLRGGKKGGGRTPKEAADNLRSTQVAQVLDLWGEGEIVGPVNGLKSVYLDGVPIENPDGTRNFENVAFAWTVGTQGQPALPGIDAVQNEIGVSQRVDQDTPVVRTINDPSVDTVRVTIGVPQLTKQDVKTGDLNGNKFEYCVEVQSDGGGYVEVYRETIEGKTTSNYRRSKKFQLQGDAPFDIRVRRLSPDPQNSAEQSAFWWESYTEIQTLRLRYPNSAIAALTVNAQQFSRIPTRAYDILGLRVRVPTNYNPLNKTYSGLWDGTFKLAWTDNPAWVFYDLVTHPRYGLGEYIAPEQVDKWQLYKIGRYCDEWVEDGRGGQEPRFTCNLYLQTREEAYKVIQDLAAVFRGMVTWANGLVSAVQDAPSDPVALFSPANVTPEGFDYPGASGALRHSVAIVYYNDLSQLGKRVPEVYVDDAMVARYGIRELELSPIGCWSRAQARRVARWALYSEQHEDETVAFVAGAQGAMLSIGSVFQVADPAVAGERLGGRVRSATTGAVTLDAPVTLAEGEQYTLTVTRPAADGSMALVTEERQVITPPGQAQVITVSPAFSEAPVPESVWVLQSDAVASTLWRCLSVVERDGGDSYEVVGVAHHPDKYDFVERDIALEDRPISRIDVLAKPPTDLVLQETVYTDGTVNKARLTIGWVPAAPGMTFRVSWRVNGGTWNALAETPEQTVDVAGLDAGVYDVAVRAVNAQGLVSLPLEGSISLLGGAVGVRGIKLRPSAWLFKASSAEPPVVVPPVIVVTAERTGGLEGAVSWSVEAGVAELTEDGDTCALAYGDLSTDSVTIRAAVLVGDFVYTDAITLTKVRDGSRPTAGELLEELEGRITRSQLAQDLLAPIDNMQEYIDGAIEVIHDHRDRLAATQLSGLLLADEALARARARAKDDNQRALTAIEQERTERIEESEAQAGIVTIIAARVDSNTAAITEEATVRANAVEAVASQVTVVQAQVQGNTAAIVEEVQARANAVEAVATQLTGLTATVDGNHAMVTSEITALANAQGAMASQINTVSAAANRVRTFAQSSQPSNPREGDLWIQTTNNNRVARYNGGSWVVLEDPRTAQNLAAISTETTARATADAALGQRIDTLVSNVNGIQASMVTVSQVQSTVNSAIASNNTVLRSEIGDVSSAVQSVSNAFTSLDGRVSASHMIKVEATANGRLYQAGIAVGVSSGSAGSTVESMVLVNANTFAVITPLSGTPTVPFAVDGGVTYIRKAMIKDADIDTLKIAGNAVTANEYAQVGSGTIAAGGSVTVVSKTISVPANSSGLLIWGSIALTAASGATVGVEILVNGASFAVVGYSVKGGNYDSYVTPAFAVPYPGGGVHNVQMRVFNPTSGPGSNQALAYQTASLMILGAKR